MSCHDVGVEGASQRGLRGRIHQGGGGGGAWQVGMGMKGVSCGGGGGQGWSCGWGGGGEEGCKKLGFSGSL